MARLARQAAAHELAGRPRELAHATLGEPAGSAVATRKAAGDDVAALVGAPGGIAQPGAAARVIRLALLGERHAAARGHPHGIGARAERALRAAEIGGDLAKLTLGASRQRAVLGDRAARARQSRRAAARAGSATPSTFSRSPTRAVARRTRDHTARRADPCTSGPTCSVAARSATRSVAGDGTSATASLAAAFATGACLAVTTAREHDEQADDAQHECSATQDAC